MRHLLLVASVNRKLFGKLWNSPQETSVISFNPLQPGVAYQYPLEISENL